MEPSVDLVELVAENTRLKSELSFADDKVKALTIFAARHDNALWLLANTLSNETLTNNYDRITTAIDNTVDTSRSTFPSLEDLITKHEDPEEVRETLNWPTE